MWWTLEQAVWILLYPLLLIRLRQNRTRRTGEIKITVCPHKSSCTRPFMWSTGPMFKRNNQATFAYHARSLRSSRILPEHTMGTASHGRYDCTQFIIRYHLLYSNLIPSHPVPQPSWAHRPLRTPLYHPVRLSHPIFVILFLKSCNSEVQTLFTN